MVSSRPEPRLVHVFIASPGDLAVERRVFKDVIDDLNGGFGDGAGVRFVALGWEDTLATTGRRAQGVINQDIDRSEVFVLALHRRWGQEGAGRQTLHLLHRRRVSPRDGPLEEDRCAGDLRLLQARRSPLDGRCRPAAREGAGLPQVLEDSRQVLYRFFEDEKAFKVEVDRHLRAYAGGELPKADAPREAWSCRSNTLEAVTKAKAEAQAAVERAETHQKHAEVQAARADELALVLAEQAAAAALEGRIEEARQTFARAHEGTTNLQVLYLAFELYCRTGDLKAAEDMLERWLAISGREAETGETATAYGNLGLIYQTRGELDRAEEMHKSLAIEEKLGRQEGMASDYGNLGHVYQTRGVLERAEEMYQKALALFKAVGAAPEVKQVQAWLDSLNESRAER